MKNTMSFNTTLAVQLTLLLLALFITIFRLAIRITKISTRLLISDYFVILSWLFLLAFFLSTTLASAWGALNMYDESAIMTQQLLKSLYAACFFYDMGLYWPKASLVAFYYTIIPEVFHRQRIALYIVTAYVAGSYVASTCVDLFFCWPISQEWSLAPGACSVWTSNITYRINFALNISCDVLVFCLPFSLLQYITTSRQEKYGLMCTFLLGAITITIGILRFIWVDIDWQFSPSAIWCSGEMCASIIVVNLPTFKFLFKSKPAISTSVYREKQLSLSQCTTTLREDSVDWDIILQSNS